MKSPGSARSRRRWSLLHRAAARRLMKCAARFSASTATRWRFSSSTRISPALMPAMTMPWKVQSATMLDNARARRPDHERTSRSTDSQGVITKITKLGTAKPDVPAPARTAQPGVKYLMPGDAVPEPGVRRSGGRDASLSRRSAATGPGRHVHLHEMPDSDVLSRRWIGSLPKRRRSSRRRSSTRRRAPAFGELRPEKRHAGGAEDACAEARGRSQRLDVRHRRPRGDRPLCDEHARDAGARRSGEPR